MSRTVELTVVTVLDCAPCTDASDIAEEFVRQNRPLAVALRTLDVDRDPDSVVDLGVVSHPTMLLSVDGVEHARISHPLSTRRVLYRFLPVVYPDPAQALRELRRQLGSPGEEFPGRGRARVAAAQKLALLESVPLFAGLNRRRLKEIGRIVDEAHHGAGVTLTRVGDQGDEFFVVVDGEVEVRRNGRRVAVLGPGANFGEMSLLDGKPRSATVTTTTETTLLVIHRHDFDRVLLRHPQLMRSLLATLSERLR